MKDLNMKKKSNLLFALAVALFVLWADFFIARTSFTAVDGKRYYSLFDDAMISMRYAWNFSHGYGLVWNPGELVEGYTNFLMTMVMSIATFFFNEQNAVLAVQIFGALTVVGIVWQARELYRQTAGKDLDPMLYNLFPILLLLYYPLSYWPLMGMETGLVTFFNLLAVNMVIRFELEGKGSRLTLSAFFASLAYLARPDAGLIILPIGLYLVTRKINWKKRFLYILQFGVIFFILPAAHMLFRYIYYGELLPNTFFLKLTGLSSTERLKAGLLFTYPFLTATLPLWVFASLNTFLNFSRRKLMLFSAGLFFVLYQIWVGGDAWNYWRMVTPVVPMIMILFLDELYTFTRVFIQSLLTPFWHGYLSRRPAWKLDNPMLKGISRTAISYAFMAIGVLFIVLISLAEISGVGKAGFGYTQLLFLIVAVLFVLFSWLIGAAGKDFSRRTHLVFFSIGTAAVMIFANLRFIPQMVFYAPPYQASSNSANINTAVAINAVTEPDASIGVFWAGTMPYYTHRYGVDFLGKSDVHIAHMSPPEGTNVKTLPGHNKFDLVYSILERQPDFVPGFEWGGQDVSEEARALYTRAVYKGVNMYLRKKSDKIRWEMVEVHTE